ncbi:type 2 lanthipeptide synthetase LanM family protein [Brucella intermedia]|uniref:type 2 lanthipeptide synthetase LanM family protein n=1 Tax=Brucella intermedia TaxID=94625 RepID=UPI000A864D1D|nr:type 2 lanthipeptide synthetase LanM family protein [Brucella intermedia]
MEKRIDIFSGEAFSRIYRDILSDKIVEIRSRATGLVPSDVLDHLLESSFMPALRQLWERALILELNQAGKRGVLEGGSEEKRFEYFCVNILKKDNLNAFYEKYPALKSFWNNQANLLFSNILVLIERINSDIGKVVHAWSGEFSAIKVAKITPIGDFHRGLKCAARIDYHSDKISLGTVYYKPRSLQIDEGYAKFIEWWNDYAPITHRAPRVLNKGSYGWVEAISHLECTNDNIHAYYRRYGSLLAIASIFGTTDLHMENVIAHGEFPVVVDLETLFSCTPELKKDNPSYYHSYSSLLLPTHAVDDQVETSPLSASPEAKTDLETLINPQRRSASLRMEPVVFVTGKNEIEVKVDGRVIDFRNYKHEIIRGCNESLEFIYKNKDEFRKIVISAFCDARVRILVRATVEYQKILYNMGHPVTLYQNMMKRDANILCVDYYDGEILSSEIAQLLNGDVPYFEMEFGGCSIVGGNGDVLEVPIHHSPLAKFEHQLSRNGDDVVRLISADIEHAFCAYNVRVGAISSPAVHDHVTETAHFAKDDLIWFDECAGHSLDVVKEKSCTHGDIIYWRQINAFEDKAIRAGISEISLYDGLAGMALAYHVVGRRLQRMDFLAFSTEIAQQTACQLEAMPYATLGAYTGTAGTLWALCVIFQDNPIKVLKTVETELAKITYALVVTEYDSYFQMDVISGVAGTVMMLIRLHELFCDFPVADAIQRVVDLAYRVLKANSDALLRENTLVGYAHGTAGVSAALANYMTYFGRTEKDALRLIEANVARETSFRTPQGWPDLDHNDIRNTSWCHGTTGFGFSRAQIRPFMSEKTYHEDIAIVRRRLGEQQESLCLCHGLAGDYYLARRMGWGEEKALLRQFRLDVERSGLRTDFGLRNFEMNGALNGISGLFIGDHLL